MLSAKDDFKLALAFIDKLEEVDVSKFHMLIEYQSVQVKGVEPLGNVLEFYGGNDTLVRSEEDFKQLEKDDLMEGMKFRDEAKKLNKHMKANYVVLNTPKQFNPDQE